MSEYFFLGDEGPSSVAMLRTGRQIEVRDFERLQPPDDPEPDVGDSYTVARGASGSWYLWDDDVATYAGSGLWTRSRASAGMRVRKAGTSEWRVHDGTGWRVSEGLGVAADGLTASAVQAQGEARLACGMNRLAVVGTTGDAATLPPARAGATCFVANDGVNGAQLFPDVGETIDAGVADAAVTLAAGGRAIFFSAANGAWLRLVGA